MTTLEKVAEAQEALNNLMEAELPLRNILLKGTVDPTQAPGVAAPEAIFYYNTTSKLRYEKIGPLNTDWRLAGSNAADASMTDHLNAANPHPVYVLTVNHNSDINALQQQIDDLRTGFTWEEVQTDFNVNPLLDNVKRYRVNSSSAIIGTLPETFTDGQSVMFTDQSDNWDTYNFQLEIPPLATYTLEGAVDIGGGVFRTTFNTKGLTVLIVYDASENKVSVNSFAGGGSGGAGIVFNPTPITANTTIVSLAEFSGYFIDTTSGPVQVTLDPAVQLVAGETRIAFIDLAGNYNVNGFTFITTPRTVYGDVGGYSSNTQYESVQFIYTGETQGLVVETIA
ncbi:MAG: hypothetical protein WC967_09160 [Balneolaceae bacterium]